MQGKISRLPESIREEINRRLYDGHTGRQVAKRLNTLPEVQELLTSKFQRLKVKKIREQNVSAWRQSAYAEWLRAREEAELRSALSS